MPQQKFALQRQLMTDDPLTRAMAPPLDETPEERIMRETSAAEAAALSAQIDAVLSQERAAEKKRHPVKVLLLGQSESGKSTTLKNFQLMYAPQSFREQRASWRLVIQLNLVRSVRIILDALTRAQDAYEAAPPESDSSADDVQDEIAVGNVLAEILNGGIGGSPASPSSSWAHRPMAASAGSRGKKQGPITDDLRRLKMRLLPLLHIEDVLIRRLAPPEELEATHLGLGWTSPYAAAANYSQSAKREIYVRSGSGWREKLASIRSGRGLGLGTVDFDDPDDPGHVIRACKEDMSALWEDDRVKDILSKQKLRLEELPGFFLNDIDRITSPDYIPSDDDVLRARLKTIGVSEHKFMLEEGAGVGAEWRLYDVGGTRTQRQAWLPYFEHIDAILFLAPISAFDQALVEDRSVNRLEDSLILFKGICSAKLLQRVNIILFLNKCDILRSKLDAGVRVSKYVRSYGDRSNDLETVCKFFRSRFNGIHKQATIQPTTRAFYIHLTSVTDTKSTSAILSNVCEVVFRANLKMSHLI